MPSRHCNIFRDTLAIPVTKSGATESACLYSVHTTTIAACCRSFYCCAEFHLFLWRFAPCRLWHYKAFFLKKNYPEDCFLLFLLFCGEGIIIHQKRRWRELLARGRHGTLRTLSSAVRVLKVLCKRIGLFLLVSVFFPSHRDFSPGV